MRCFLKKKAVKSPQRWKLRPQKPNTVGLLHLRALPPYPTLLLPPIVTTFSSSVVALMRFYYCRKRAKITIPNVLLLFFPRFFHFIQTLHFVGGGAKIFFPPDTGYPY